MACKTFCGYLIENYLYQIKITGLAHYLQEHIPTMKYLQQSFQVKFEYKVFFTSGLFNPSNTLLNDFLKGPGIKRKILFVVDEGVGFEVVQQLKEYFKIHHAVQLVPEVVIVPGGEILKNEIKYFDQILEAVNEHKIDRHSYIAAIGGGSVLDLVGYAAAVSHRGIRHIRIPTTVLSQNDSGIGVKNGINYFGKKNFLGISREKLQRQKP